MTARKVSHLKETKKSDQPSGIAKQAKAEKEPKAFTFTEEEFERLENLSSSVFDLNNSLAELLSGNGEGLNHCLGLVAHDFDNLVCDVREREEKKQGGAV